MIVYKQYKTDVFHSAVIELDKYANEILASAYKLKNEKKFVSKLFP